MQNIFLFLNKWFRSIPKFLIGLFVVVVIFSLVIIITQLKTEPITDALLNFDINNVQKISINRGDKETILEKISEDIWNVGEDQIGDTVAIQNFIYAIKEIKPDIIISHNTDKQSQFQVTVESGSEVKMFGVNGEVIAHFFAGKTTPNWQGQYFRLDGSDEIIQYNKNLMNLFFQDYIKKLEESEEEISKEN